MHPLVSIAVITYKSSDYVLETLESIKAQTYNKIELIISDDCSPDSTVDVCRKWIDENSTRFERTAIITADKNTGPSGNYNRAESACRGEWVITIDGDDLLLPNAIEDYIQYITDNPESNYIFARIKAFGCSEERCKHYEEEIFDAAFFKLSSEQQLKELLSNRNHICSGTFFYNRNARLSTGVINDERIPMLEDWPKWVNLLKAGAKFSFLDRQTILYRLHSNSISTGSDASIPRKFCAQYFVYYQFQFLWKNNPRMKLLEQYCFVRKVATNGMFWRIIVNVLKGVRKLFGKDPVPFSAKFFYNFEN